MAILPGTRQGPFEVVCAIGVDAMGEARDTRLERTVAIKLLPAHLADNPNLRTQHQN